MQNTTQSTQVKFFDFVTTGVGYINDLRVISKQGGLACKITALVGDANAEPQDKYRFLQLNVTGKLANAQMAVVKKAMDAGKRIFVSFSVGELRPHEFTYEKGEKAGQKGLSLKGRLIKLNYAKADKDVIDLPTIASLAPSAPVEQGTQLVEKPVDTEVPATPPAVEQTAVVLVENEEETFV